MIIKMMMMMMMMMMVMTAMTTVTMIVMKTETRMRIKSARKIAVNIPNKV